MKKAVILGERQAGLVEVPDPQPKEDWVLVKVHAAPMCTEYKGWLRGSRWEYLGHEAAGEVVAVAQPGKVAVGDRVVVMPQYPCGKCELCISGDYIHCEQNIPFDRFVGSPEGKATMAQYLLKPSWLLPKIPDGVPYERAALACCALGPTYGALRRMNVTAYDTVLITGLGPVGLGGVVNARFRGARVFGVDLEPWRLERAEQMGAEVFDARDPQLLEKIRAKTGGRGVDAAIDASGTVQAERLCIDATRRRGRVAFVGECGDPLEIRVSPDLIRKGLTVIGNWHYPLQGFPDIMEVVQRSPLIDLLISHVLPMSEIQKAMEISASHRCAKIILLPWE